MDVDVDVLRLRLRRDGGCSSRLVTAEGRDDAAA